MTNNPNPVRNYDDAGSKKREILIGLVAAIAVLGFVIYGVMSMGGKVGRHGMHGVILEKHFDPIEQTQITVGQQGLDKRAIDGQYWFKVHVENRNLDYYVYVTRAIYRQHKIGDKYYFVRMPKPVQQTPPASR